MAEKAKTESIWEPAPLWKNMLLQVGAATVVVAAADAPDAVLAALWVPEWGTSLLKRAGLSLLLAYPILWLLAGMQWKVSRIGLCSLWGWVVAASAFAYWRVTGLDPPAIPFLAALAVGWAFCLSMVDARERRTSTDTAVPSGLGAPRLLRRRALRWLVDLAAGRDFLRWGPLRLAIAAAASAVLLIPIPALIAPYVSCAFTFALALVTCAWLVVWLCAARARKVEPTGLAFLFVLCLAASQPFAGWARLDRAVPLFDLPVRVLTLIDAAVAIALAAVNAIWGRKWRGDAQLASAGPQES